MKLSGVVVAALTPLTSDGVSLADERTFSAYYEFLLQYPIAGLFVWLIPWRNIQTEVGAPGESGEAGRHSIVRRLYLYFYLLLATLTFLGSSVYAVSQIIYLLLGGRTAVNLAADMAQAVSYALLAVVVWLYHGRLLRLTMPPSNRRKRGRRKRCMWRWWMTPTAVLPNG